MTIGLTATDLAEPRYLAQVRRVLAGLGAGRLEVILPDGRSFVAEGAAPGPQATLRLRDNDVFARLIREGELGFCDAYLDGDWDTPDLMAFLDLIQLPQNNRVNDGFPGMGLVRAYERMRHWLRGNSKAQARRNIAYHYDLGNDFYGLWLDETMTYSSALFGTGQETLAEAQAAKYQMMLDRIGAKPGDHLLEIGCGWGGFAEHAARAGMRLTCLTISREQRDYAMARIARAGFADQVEIRLQDYRDERGRYDGIASIEMFEAVGEAYWPAYFETLHTCLKPGAKANLQIITVPDHRFASYRKSVDFIQKYIFPGGMLPSPSALAAQIAQAGLRHEGSVEFGRSYSRTLRLWHAGFNRHWPEVKAMGFDERFRRMWNFYLCSCAGAFEGGNCDVTQISMMRP
ncbi:MAG: class I SAM-dependent methyltransferase [Gemmobacter sp.]|uniref:SAM-dependent methyltransferase n=1 Tax=Gemmobacter sp. TaxID=1898957 RepID=UPI001A60DB2D|nr:cyclopropane-fatty-acyl-phospholipid synthase family protein [Gemmobacter sp.]MBL8561614.1 class I SAM-dependent methyltransferase [Gemmobacter sp.]